MEGRLRKFFLRVPPLRFILRTKVVLFSILHPVSESLKWLMNSNETTNFTYRISKMNVHYLASLIADILEVPLEKIVGYIHELENDRELHAHLMKTIAGNSMDFESDRKFLPGRRIGWYVFARAIKPKTIIETGVDKGLGACILSAALKKNSEEGYPGKYYGTDINLGAGYLLSGEYQKFGEVLYGDSVNSLKKFKGKIDLFINDSNHSPEYEREEYMAIKGKLSRNSVILSDNSHCTEELRKFSIENKRHFIFFKENPIHHWHSGAGIGISFVRV